MSVKESFGPSNAPRNIGVIFVHDGARAERYGGLKQLVSAFYASVKRVESETPPKLLVEVSELTRRTRRSPESSDVDSKGVASDELHSLFQPLSIRVGVDTVRFYEVCWADEDNSFGYYEKLKYNLWLTTTMWNPLWNVLRHRKRSLKTSSFLTNQGRLSLYGMIYHLSELAFVPLSFVLRKTEPFSRLGDRIYDYAGDVKLYASQRELFYNQTKKDVALSRFDETYLKAFLENDDLHVIGTGIGGVIARDGLTRHPVYPSKMSPAFKEFLDTRDESAVIDTTKLRTFITFGAPLDRHYFVWPYQRQERLQPSFVLERRATPAGNRERWTARGESTSKSEADLDWFNFYESADPLGERVDLYRGDGNETFPTPKNICLASATLPSRAHASYFRNRELQDWMVKRIFARRENAPSPPGEASEPKRFITFLANVLLAAFSVGSILLLFVIAFDFLIRFGHDLYMDAESHTVYGWLWWLDRGAVALWDLLGFSTESWLWACVGVAGGAVALWFVAGLGSGLFHLQSSKRYEHRMKELALWEE